MATTTIGSMPQHGTDLCRVCNYSHIDLRLAGCGCAFHVTCVPLSAVFDHGPSSSGNGSVSTTAGASSCKQCSFCKTGTFSGIYIEPLSFQDIDKSIALRKEASRSSPPSGSSSVSSGGSSSNITTKDGASDEDKAAHAAYAVYSQVKPDIASGLRDAEGSGRTGRWTDGEVEYVDHIVTLFDQGELPLPEGTKLGSFLGDILLCRTSRLTKKMKKAKLSARTFKLKSRNGGHQFSTAKDSEFLSMLQEGFVRSMPEEYTRVEIRFNLARKWRTYFLELCMQVGYARAVAGDWIASLDEFDRRASVAKEQVKTLDRRRMISGSFQKESMKTSSETVSAITTREDVLLTSTRRLEATQGDDTTSLISSYSNQTKRAFELEDPKVGLDLDETEEPRPKRPRSGSEELDTLIGFMEEGVDVIDEDSSTTTGQDSCEEPDVYNSMPRSLSSAPKTFPDVVAALMESHNLPFDYADVWVPSVANSRTIRLLSAGHATRRDQLGAGALEDFGEYSQKFSFNAGSGLPGRVYSTGRARWEFKICDSDPAFFLRAEGAKAHGIKTAVGIPLHTTGLGKIVVVFYSRQELTEDSSIATMCLAGLSRYSPSPKWKLVVDKGDDSSSVASSLQESSSYSSFSGALLPPTAGGPSPQNDGDQDDETVQDIISLLGNQLSARTDGSSNSVTSQGMLNLRLFLLTPSSRLSDEDMGLVSIIKTSFEYYSKDTSRAQSDIAELLTREWAALQSSRSPGGTTSTVTYRRYVLDPVLTPAQRSAPVGLCRPGLTFQQPPSNSRPDEPPSILSYDHSKIQLSMAGGCDQTTSDATTIVPRCRTVSLQSMANSSATSKSITPMSTALPYQVISLEPNHVNYSR